MGAELALKAHGIKTDREKQAMMQRFQESQLQMQTLQQQHLQSQMQTEELKRQGVMEGIQKEKKFGEAIKQARTIPGFEVPGQGPMSPEFGLPQIMSSYQEVYPTEYYGKMAENLISPKEWKPTNPSEYLWSETVKQQGKSPSQNIKTYYKIDAKGNVVNSVALDENDPNSLARVQKEGLVPSTDPRIIGNRAITNINLTGAWAGKGTWEKETAKDYAEEWKKAKAEAIGAQGNLARIAQMKQSLGKGYQGKLASLKSTVGAYYESITGQSVSKAQETQIAQAIANRIALSIVGGQVEGGGMPANLFSEADRDFVVQANANPNLTPEANAKLLDLAERAEKFKQLRATAMTQYIGLKGQPDAGMYPYVEKQVSKAFEGLTQFPTGSKFKILKVE